MSSLIISVCMGTGGISAGGKDVFETFKSLLDKKSISARFVSQCKTQKVGCRGLCAKDVLVDVILDGNTTTYHHVKPEMIQKIVDEHIIGGNPVTEWTVSEDYHKFHEKQHKVILSQCGRVDPEDLQSYISVGGYEALKSVLKRLTPQDVIDIVKKSGLRGRGGAGFLTGVKWQLCKDTDSSKKYIICNADEGDPGAFMDRAIIEGNPHCVIEGLLIGAYGIGAKEGYFYIRAEYPLAVKRLKLAIKQAEDYGFLGKNILNSDFSMKVRVKLGAGAFVCGEETALIASIEGKRGMPRAKPPFPVYKGLWGMPTVINNVETLANIPFIIRNGHEWFSSFGTENSKGTKIFSITGKVKNTGLIEVPMGITLREIIYDIGGGIEKDKSFKAVQTGGPSGGCIPSDKMDLKVDYETLSEAGSIMGSGGLIVLDEDDCMVSVARYFLNFTKKESCGKCVPCRIGTMRLFEILDRITKGEGKAGDIELLEFLSNQIRLGSLCGLGQTAPNPVLSTIRYFRDEYEAHIKQKRCPARVCKALLTFSIMPDRCKGCGICLKQCPVNAIDGKKKKPHSIIQDRCIKCGVCLDVCKFSAVDKV